MFTVSGNKVPASLPFAAHPDYAGYARLGTFLPERLPSYPDLARRIGTTVIFTFDSGSISTASPQPR